ncbi:hypothetical protein [Burkholderia sp. BCC1977]|uniref:hypothetical protein n=1 Tax=Burkholderia sp. BCC1977 TaxID=2817440 RepID=UPI002ABE7F42|nr:hypothetical protein [Burkholderia sp. BCC1977]
MAVSKENRVDVYDGMASIFRMKFINIVPARGFDAMEPPLTYQATVREVEIIEQTW